MQEKATVIATAMGSSTERAAAKRAFLNRRDAIWSDIAEGRFPKTYISADGRRFSGAPCRTAIRCDFLLANKIALGAMYRTDRIADKAQRDLLFYVLRDRETFPNRTGSKFYCCPKCTSKIYECVSSKVFRYVDNAKWKALIERGASA